MTSAVPVRLVGLRKFFGTTCAVDSVSIDVAPAELLTLLGPSGCGKTTVLRMVAGLETATKGRVFIGDGDVTDLPPNARDTSMVFQSYALFPHMTVFENVAYGLTVQKRPGEEIRGMTEEALEMIGLGGLGGRSPSALSGGQQQRVALARALVTKPKVLLFDEPLSNLDAKLRKYMREEIRAMQKRAGITALYVTHDQTEAMAIADRIVVMDRGRIAQAGQPADLYARPVSRFVAEFIGEANFIDVTQAAWSDGKAVLKLGGDTVVVDHPTPITGPITLMVRPEAVSVSREPPGLYGRVERSVYLGSSLEFTLKTSFGELNGVAVPPKPDVLKTGNSVNVRLLPEGTHILPKES